jgi:hypothetical protein
MNNIQKNEVTLIGSLGNKEYIKDYNETLSQDTDGIFTATEVFTGIYSKVRDSFMLEHDGSHTYLDWIKLTNKGFQTMAGGLARFTFTFKGVREDDEYVRYSVSSSARTEPIQTHPHFTKGKDIPKARTEIEDHSKAYGYAFGRPKITKAEGSNQAYYESTEGTSVFKHFDRTAKFDLNGVQEYFELGMTVNATFVTHADSAHKTNIKDGLKDGGFAFSVGQRFDDLPSAVNVKLPTDDLYKNVTWLVNACEVDIIGSAMRQRVSFLMSDKRGWNGLIYRTNKKSDTFSDDTYGSVTV